MKKQSNHFISVNNLNFLLFILLTSIVSCQMGNNDVNNSESSKYKIEQNIFYKVENDLTAYENSRCFLDLYVPVGKENFPVLVWFHGGSIERLSKDEKYTQSLGAHFATKGIAVAVANYRLHPETKYPDYIKDAAASVFWVKQNISQYGGNHESIFIGGHSAGAYISLMIGMDEKYLANFGFDIKDLCGLIPLGAQTLTHYTVRKEMNITDYKNTPVINEAAPIFHARSDTPPIIAICGDGDSFGRKVENICIIELLNKLGHENAKYFEVKNHKHWDLVRKIHESDNAVSGLICDFVFKHIN